MDWANLQLGVEAALTPTNIVVCLIGVAIGTAVGVLPGIGPTATIALLLPITFNLDAVAALIMLAGIYYRCAVRRVHERDPAERPRRVLGRGDGHRRVPDGPTR